MNDRYRKLAHELAMNVLWGGDEESETPIADTEERFLPLLADFARTERLDEAEQWEKHGFLQLDGEWCRERIATLRSTEGERSR